MALSHNHIWARKASDTNGVWLVVGSGHLRPNIIHDDAPNLSDFAEITRDDRIYISTHFVLTENHPLFNWPESVENFRSSTQDGLTFLQWFRQNEIDKTEINENHQVFSYTTHITHAAPRNVMDQLIHHIFRANKLITKFEQNKKAVDNVFRTHT